MVIILWVNDWMRLLARSYFKITSLQSRKLHRRLITRFTYSVAPIYEEKSPQKFQIIGRMRKLALLGENEEHRGYLKTSFFRSRKKRDDKVRVEIAIAARN